MAIVEYEHEEHPEWDVKLYFDMFEDRQAGYFVWEPYAIEWGLFVPVEEQERCEASLMRRRVKADQNAPDPWGSRYRPRTSKPSQRQARRPNHPGA